MPNEIGDLAGAAALFSAPCRPRSCVGLGIGRKTRYVPMMRIGFFFGPQPMQPCFFRKSVLPKYSEC